MLALVTAWRFESSSGHHFHCVQMIPGRLFVGDFVRGRAPVFPSRNRPGDDFRKNSRSEAQGHAVDACEIAKGNSTRVLCLLASANGEVRVLFQHRFHYVQMMPGRFFVCGLRPGAGTISAIQHSFSMGLLKPDPVANMMPSYGPSREGISNEQRCCRPGWLLYFGQDR